MEYEDLCDENGMMRLDITKLEVIISYYASRIMKLYKVKLMKMLWYADSLCYKLYGHSMTGLVYCHEGMGALPIGHYKIGGLQKVCMEEEFDGENIKYRFLPTYNGKLSGGRNEGGTFEWKVADGRTSSKIRREHERKKIKQYHPEMNGSRGGEGRIAKRRGA